MKALEDSGRQDETLVLFLSDHGMPLPFAKTQLYHHSTRTPLVVHVPGITQPGAIDERHMVSAVDFVPTLTDLLGWRKPGDLDGRSFAPVIQGQTQAGRDFVVKEYNENSGAKRNPMRAIETKDYLYIFNPWSNGNRPMATATNGTQSYKRMKQLAAENSEIAARVELMDHREVEELYHVANDPDCLVNLIDVADYEGVANELRSKLLEHMQQTNDPIAELLPKREDPSALESYMQRVQQEANDRRAKRKNNQKKAAVKRTGVNSRKKWIAFTSVEAGNSTLQVTISHKLPANAGKKKLTVTLKGADKKRISRQEVEISGAGNAEIVFESVGLDANACSVAAFVGPSYQMSLQHIQKTVAQIKQH